MNRSTSIWNISIVVLHVAALMVAPAHAQGTAKKPAPKPGAVKTAPPKKATGPVVLGTTQLPGDFGQLGTTYTIGKNDPINFTLRSAEYSIVPVTVGNNTWVPKGDQKVLVLHYTVHNPQPREQNYYWGSIGFTAVDARDTNHEFIQAVTREGEKEALSITLKPAQKLDVTTAIIVPANGVVPKLIVARHAGEPVIRYDLHGKVTALPTLAADTTDTTGATALKEIAAQAGTFYSTGYFDMRLDSVAYVDGPLLNREPGKDKRYMTATFTIKNRTGFTQRYVWSDFLPDLRDSDGEKVAYTQALLKASRDESGEGEMAAGEEARIRFFFALPTKVTGKTLRLSEGKGVDARIARVFAFDVASVAPTTATK